jgi:hypothetical protein
MIHAWPSGAKFFEGLLDYDARELVRAQREGCPRCGERLDRADFPRKPRGIPPGWETGFSRRFSLCCSREGCRKRLTPPSVRFLGRRVYAAVVVLAASISALVASAVPRRTLRRWSAWWSGAFAESAFFRTARARLMPPVDVTRLPRSLVERFAAAEPFGELALLRALVFVTPLSVSSPSFSRDGP